jgi:hypothetical protein
MVHDFVIPRYLTNMAGPINSNNLMIPSVGQLSSTREVMVKLLTHPYSPLGATAEVTADQYYWLIASLFNGNDDLKLGRPRYLSDQLWHKVLLTSSEQDVDNPSAEAGPAALEARRGVVAMDRAAIAANLVRRGANNAQVNRLPVGGQGLKFWGDRPAGAGRGWIVNPTAANRMPDGTVLYCAELGKVRFDTKLVRNLVWLVQLQRIMRVVLIDHLSWLDTPVVKGLKIADPVVTEYNSNDQFSANDYDGSRYDVI